MAVKMAKNIVEERLRWVLPIFNNEVKLVDVVKVCPHSQRSLERWVASYRESGEIGLEAKSTRPKTNPNETPIWVKEKIIDLRNENRKCALKLKWDLEKENILIHERTIGKIIKVEGLTRRYRIRKIEYKYVKALLRQGELIEIDVKYVPKKLGNRRYFQYTAIDVASRWRHLVVCDEQSNFNAVDFLKTVIDIFHSEGDKHGADAGISAASRDGVSAIAKIHYLQRQEVFNHINRMNPKVSLPSQDTENILRELDKDEQKAREDSKVFVENLKSELAEVEVRLDKLLSAYLDEVITSEEYATQKQKMLDQRVELKEKIHEIEDKGVSWLEPILSKILEN